MDDTIESTEDGSKKSDTNDQPGNGAQNSENKRTSLKDSKFAWLVCASSFTIQVLHVGFLHAFGVFFVAFSKEFGSSKAAVGRCFNQA